MLKKFLIMGIVLVAFAMFAFSVGDNHGSQLNENVIHVDKTYEPIVVLELFTSQGCSSCPAADRLLDEVKQLYPENVFTLSYHVDYWNYIGWKDPFSKAVYSEKQSNYNRKLNYRGNYTPELVVNGKAHFTGSNRAKMNAAISNFKGKRVENKVSILKFEQNKGKVSFDYNVEGNLDNKNLRTILVLDERTTAIKRGENRDRIIKNTNVVVAENLLPLTKEMGKMGIDLPDMIQENEKISLILLVSNENLDVTAATKMDFVK